MIATKNGGAELLARLDRIPVWPHSRSVLWVVGAGFFFSFFDIITIGFSLPVITREFDVSAESASWAITSGLIGYIIGSFLDSRIGDRYGRRVSLYLSVGMFSIGSLLSATSTDLGWLIFWRLISGMGIGAEIALATTYIGEMSPAPLRGRYTGWAISCAFAGFAVVPLLALYLVPEFSWGWRALFVIGAAGGILIAVMRRSLPNSIHWLITQNRLEEAERTVLAAEVRAQKRIGRPLPAPAPVLTSAGSPEGGFSLLFHRKTRNQLILLGIIWFVYYVGNYAWLTLAADLFAKHGFSLSQSIGSLAITGFGFVAGSIAAVYLSDRIDRRKTASVVAILWAATLVIIGYFPSPAIIAIFGFAASCTIGFIIPILYTITGESFPTRARATGVSLSDGVGHLGGAFCGQIIFAIESFAGFSGAFIAMAVTGILTAVLVLFIQRQTGKSLDEIGN